MKAWTIRTSPSLLVLRFGRLCLSVAVLGAASCSDPVPPDGGSNEATPPRRQPILQPSCASVAVDASSVFEPTAGPRLARFQLVAATDTAVFASSGASLHRSLDEGATWSLVDAPELRG